MIPRRRAGLTATLLMAPLITLAAQSPASADVAGNCAGQQIDSATIKVGGHTAATLRLYYDSASKKNCAKATNDSGAAHHMALWLFRCEAGTGATLASCRDLDSPTEDLNYDSGTFGSYAGPVHNKKESAGLCIHAGVMIVIGNADPYVEIGGHCG